MLSLSLKCVIAVSRVDDWMSAWSSRSLHATEPNKSMPWDECNLAADCELSNPRFDLCLLAVEQAGSNTTVLYTRRDARLVIDDDFKGDRDLSSAHEFSQVIDVAKGHSELSHYSQFSPRTGHFPTRNVGLRPGSAAVPHDWCVNGCWCDDSRRRMNQKSKGVVQKKKGCKAWKTGDYMSLRYRHALG